MMRKTYNGVLESRNIFRRRKYCDQTCMAHAQMHKSPSRRAVQKRVRKFLGQSCEGCGTTQRLSIHHRDRNWRNNDPANLATLCMSCHTKLHHWQGDILKKKIQPPCYVCGKLSYRLGLCHTHLTRFKRHGSPYLTKRRCGSSYVLVEDHGSRSGPASPALPRG
jgi:hypothetical protein